VVPVATETQRVRREAECLWRNVVEPRVGTRRSETLCRGGTRDGSTRGTRDCTGTTTTATCTGPGANIAKVGAEHRVDPRALMRAKDVDVTRRDDASGDVLPEEHAIDIGAQHGRVVEQAVQHR
jgi:hypothetical protein